MKGKILAIMAIFLLFPLAQGLEMEQTIVTTENVSQEQYIYSGGDIESHNYFDSLGDTDFYINGVNVSAYDTPRVLGVEEYISHNNDNWLRDTTGVTKKNLESFFNKVMYIIMGEYSHYDSDDEEFNVARYLSNVFIPRGEILNYFNNLEFRVSVLENYATTQSRKNAEEDKIIDFCMSALSVAEKYGYEKITCEGKEYTLTNGEAISIEEVKECSVTSDCEGKTHIMCVGEWNCIDNACVWECEEEKEEMLPNECNGMFLSRARNIALAECDTNSSWKFTGSHKCLETDWLFGISTIPDEEMFLCVVDTVNMTAEVTHQYY